MSSLWKKLKRSSLNLTEDEITQQRQEIRDYRSEVSKVMQERYNNRSMYYTVHRKEEADLIPIQIKFKEAGFICFIKELNREQRLFITGKVSDREKIHQILQEFQS